MGLDINSVRFLIAAHKNGVRFGDVLMIGRQDLNVYPTKMVQVLRNHNLPATPFEKNSANIKYAEPVFEVLGATRCASMDASEFEGAEYVHDLNKPVPTELHERFDVIYDGGTLEHVFNFPVALKSCMEMLRVGGRLFIHTIANSWCGHGFYQFSPELFYTALNEENGYEVESMVLHAVGPYGRWYEVSNPQKIRSRVELMTLCPVHLLIQAKRVRLKSIFATMPQQSDYTPRWQTGGGTQPPKKVEVPLLVRTFPNLARLIHVMKMGVDLYRRQSILNRKNFVPRQKP